MQAWCNQRWEAARLATIAQVQRSAAGKFAEEILGNGNHFYYQIWFDSPSVEAQRGGYLPFNRIQFMD